MATKMNEAQKFIHVSKYSRWIESENRRETSWEETSSRYLDFMRKRFEEKVPKKIWKLLDERVKGLGVVPSMRAVAMAGPALEENNIMGYNCSFVPFLDLQAPVELFYILMCGTGVGLSVENFFIGQMPEVAKWAGDGAGVYVVEDSREGWANSLKAGLENWFAGKDIEFDYSKIRPRGTRLKKTGGRASGPEPLKRLHDFCRDTICKAQGRKLTSLEWLDIANMIGDVVVVGGVRRASEISFSDLNDNLIRNAKNGAFPQYRCNSNNSAVYFNKPDAATFLREWLTLVESGTGERGIFNVHAIKNMLPQRREFRWDMRSNPCFAPGTLIQTRTGHFPIEQLVGKSVEIWNGSAWQVVNNFRVTGENQSILKVTFADGSKERVTPYHTVVLDGGKRIEARELVPGMKIALSNAPESHGKIHANGAYLKGFVSVGLRGGKYKRPVLGLFKRHTPCKERLVASATEIPVGESVTSMNESVGFVKYGKKRYELMQGLSIRKHELMPWMETYRQRLPAEVFAWDRESKCEFIAGVLDRRGHRVDGACVLYSIKKEWLHDFQSLLKTVGVRSNIRFGKKAKITKPFGHSSSDKKTIAKEEWAIYIPSGEFVKLVKQVKFELLSGSTKDSVPRKNPQLAEPNTVVSVEADGVEEKVYCCTVEGSHALGLTSGFYWGNCGEIILRPFSFCNLSEVIIRAEDEFDDVVEKVEAAVWLGAMQATMTKFPYLRPDFKKNCEEERLLGVSLTGQMDNPALMTPEKLTILKKYAIKTAKKASAALGINLSAAITTGKPSGTVSQLADCASGAHPRYAKYYIRRYRLNSSDPVYRLMKDQGVKFFPENGQGPDAIEEKRKQWIAKGRTEEEAKMLVPDWDESQVMTWVCEFPSKAPNGAIVRSQVSAIEQLEWYLKIMENWCEHNQSISVYVRRDEWMKVGAWVYDHFDEVVGVSFIPYDDSDVKYKLAPYEEITKEEYEKRAKEFPKLDYSNLAKYELEDTTTAAQQLACTSGACELA